MRNAWYVAGWSREFDAEPRRVTLLGEHVAMYRDSTGRVNALEDRCPHRGLPLSLGKRVGDHLQCGYHGLTFGGDGRCVRVPGQSNIPSTACVRAWPVLERHGIVFVWTGEPALADPGRCFDLDVLDAPGWHAHHGDALRFEAGWRNVAENLVDPAHVSFVHPTTLGNAASEDVPVHVDTSGEALLAWRWIRDAPPVGFFKAPGGIGGGFEGHVDRWHYYWLHLPCTAVIDFGSAPVEAGLGDDEAERDRGTRIFAIHFLTPESDHVTIDRWMHVRNTAVEDEATSARMDAMFRVAFDEDRAILEAIEREEALMPKEASARRPLTLAIDKGPIVFRRRIDELVATERAAGAAGSTAGSVARR